MRLFREYGISQEDVRAAIGYAARDRLKKLFNPSRSNEMQSMSEQMISHSKMEEEMGKGLTAEQRRHLEKSLKDNDELMKCLAEM